VFFLIFLSVGRTDRSDYHSKERAAALKAIHLPSQQVQTEPTTLGSELTK
jgi:hypothetical protein